MTVQRSELSEALKRLKACVGTGSSLNIFTNIHIAKGALIATNLREAIVVPSVNFGFDVCVSHRELSQLLSKTRHDEIEMRLEDSGKALIIESGDYKASMCTIDSSSYPEIVAPALEEFEELPAGFRSGLAHCSGFASRDEARYFLNGVYTEKRDIVASDGARLGKYTFDDALFEKGIILPRDLVADFLAMNLDSYKLDGTEIWFSGPDGFLRGNLIEGKYPNYKRVINDMGTAEVECAILREHLAGSDIVQVFEDSDSNVSNRVTVRVVGGEFQVESQNDRGSILFHTTLDTEENGPYDGPDFEFTVNYDYLMAAMKEEAMILRVIPVEGSSAKKIALEAGPFLAIVMGTVPREKL